jgi:hypothetical protein
VEKNRFKGSIFWLLKFLIKKKPYRLALIKNNRPHNLKGVIK